MSQDCIPKNNKRKLELKEENTPTYSQKSISSIEIDDSKFSKGTASQTVLQVLNYYEDCPHLSHDDVTFTEKIIIQNPETNTTCIQTDYTIYNQKYLNDSIKPYFLYYFDLEERNPVLSRTISDISHTSEIDIDKLIELDENFSVGSFLSTVDKSTWISPSASIFIKDYLKLLADNTVLETNKIVPDSKVEAVLPSKVFLSHKNSQHDESLEPTEIIICLKNSAGNISHFINETVLEKNSKDTIKSMSKSSKENPEKSYPSLQTCSNRGGGQEIDVILSKPGDIKYQLRCKRIEDVANEHESPTKKKYLCQIDSKNCDDFLKVFQQSKLSNNKSSGEGIILHNIKSSDGDISTSTTKLIIKSNNTKQPQNDNSSGLENRGSSKASNEKVIFACRSKTKSVDPSTKLQGESCVSDLTSAFIGEQKKAVDIINVSTEAFTAINKNSNTDTHKSHITDINDTVSKKSHVIDDMYEAHNKTMTTIKAAADDLLNHIPKLFEKANDPCTRNRVKHFAEDYACEVKKTSKLFLNNSKEVVSTISKHTVEAKDSIKNFLFNKNCINDDEEIAGDQNMTDKYQPKDMSCSSDLVDSVDKLNDSVLNTTDLAKKSIKNLATKALVIVQAKPNPPPEDDPIENLKLSAEKLVNDVRKKTEEFKEMTPEKRFILIKETTESLKSSISSNSTKILSVETPSTLSSKINDFKKSADNLVNDVRKFKDDIKEVSISDQLGSLKTSAANLYGTVAEKSLIIKESAEKLADEMNLEDIKTKKENIKNVLSGYKLFKKEKNEDEAVVKPGLTVDVRKNISSTISSLKEQMSSMKFGLDVPDKSSSYDVPTPPKQIAMKDSVNRLTGMFSNLKDKIYSIFSGNKESEQNSNNIQNENEDEENDDEIDSVEIDERIL